MLRHLKSAAARSPVRSPPPPSAPTTRGDGFEEESARAIAVSDQRTIYLVNMFIASTVEFLNSFAALCDDKLSLLHRKIVKLDSSLTLLEAKLHSIDDTNALRHSTNQKAHGLFTHDGRFDPANLLGESSRRLYRGDVDAFITFFPGTGMLDYATLAGSMRYSLPNDGRMRVHIEFMDKVCQLCWIFWNNR